MASKLTSSLRKSISAEKQSVEDKQTTTTDNIIVEPKIALENPVAKLATPRKAIRKVAVKTPTSTTAKPIVENVKTSVKSEKPVVEKPRANTAAQPNVDSVKLILEKINNSSLELSNSFVENFMGINQDFNNYLQQISEVNNLVKVQEINEKFIDNLHKRQQELIKKNMELLSSFKFI